MNELPRQTLCEIIVRYGHLLCDDPRRTEALLRDFCGEHKREIFVLVNALHARVAAELLASQDRLPYEVLLARLTRRLQDNLALEEGAARWAVETWALALGVGPNARAKTAPAAASARRRNESLSIPKLPPYILKPGVTVPTLEDFPDACEKAWNDAVEQFVRGYITDRMEKRLEVLRASDRRDQVSELEPLVHKAKALHRQAVQGDEIDRNLALEGLLQAIGQTYAGLSAPELTINHDLLDLGMVEPGNRVNAQLTITNTTRGYLAGEISSDRPWITVTPTRFGCRFGEEVVVNLGVDTGNLDGHPHGKTYSANISVSSNVESGHVPVNIQVVLPVLSVSSSTLDFGKVRNRASKEKWLEVGNDGYGVLIGQATPTKPWLRLTPTRFLCHPKTTVRIKVDAVTTSLESGFHRAFLRVDSNGGAQRILARVVHLPPPKLVITPKQLFFNLTTGRQSLHVSNPNGDTVEARVESHEPWLIIDEPLIELGEGQSADIIVRANFGRLDDRVGRSKLTVTSGSVQSTVAVEVDVRNLPPKRRNEGWQLQDPENEIHYAQTEDELWLLLADGCWINDKLPLRPITDLHPRMRLYGVVEKTLLQGAVVDIGAEPVGLLHISELPRARTNRVSEVVRPGDNVIVWITRVDAVRNQVHLTMRVFTSTLSLHVVGLKHPEGENEWQSLGTTPGNVQIPPNCAFGLKSIEFDDNAATTLVQELSDFGFIQLLDLSSSGALSNNGLSQLRALDQLKSLTTLVLSECVSITDTGLGYLRSLKDLARLDLSATNITDKGLSHLEALTRLRRLDLWHCSQITDAGLANLQALNNLTCLDLSYCDQISDNGLLHLGVLTSLKSLNLYQCTRITDQGLAHLSTLKNLTELDLSYCNQITDSGISHLAASTSLSILNLWGCTHITEAGLKEIVRQGVDVRRKNESGP
jgi:hypothetical protein